MQETQENFIPVYLFLGFLEAGKTKFIQKMLEDELSFDDIQDPLPFDLNADPIMIKDEYYALWYQDIMAEANKYQDKTIVFRAIIDRNADFPPDIYIVGRNIMTCCVEDMAFSFFLAQYHKAFTVRQNHLAFVTAKIMVQHHAARNADIPILNILHISDCTPPETETALFT